MRLPELLFVSAFCGLVWASEPHGNQGSSAVSSKTGNHHLPAKASHTPHSRLPDVVVTLRPETDSDGDGGFVAETLTQIFALWCAAEVLPDTICDETRKRDVPVSSPHPKEELNKYCKKRAGKKCKDLIGGMDLQHPVPAEAEIAFHVFDTLEHSCNEQKGDKAACHLLHKWFDEWRERHHHKDLPFLSKDHPGQLTSSSLSFLHLTAAQHSRAPIDDDDAFAATSLGEIRRTLSHATMKTFEMIPPLPTPSDGATTTLSDQASQPMIIVKTIIKTIVKNCDVNYDPAVETVFAANISGSIIPMSGSTVMFNSSTVLTRPVIPHATIHPIATDPEFLGDLLRFSMDSQKLRQDYRDIFGYTLYRLQENYPSLDWDDIGRTAILLRNRRTDLDYDSAMKHAIIWRMQNPVERQVLASGKRTSDGGATAAMVDFNGTTFFMSKPTETHNGAVFIATDRPFDLKAAAQQTPAPKPPACHDKHRVKECLAQMCMLSHVYPLEIRTVFPAVLELDREPGAAQIGYFTHNTLLTTPHWGTTKAHWTYWPMKVTKTVDSQGTPITTVIRETPHSGKKHLLGHLSRASRADAPLCWNYDTCCTLCSEIAEIQTHFWRKNNPMLYLTGLGLMMLLGLMALVACCCGGFFRGHRRRKENPELSRWEAMPVVGRMFRRKKADPKAAQEVVEVIKPQPGGLTIIEPAAIATGAAAAPGAVTGAAGNQADANGRGTLGRQAEEGRGRVNFAEGTQGGPGGTGIDSPQAGGAANGSPQPGGAPLTPGHDVPGQTVVVTQAAQQPTVASAPESTIVTTGHETAPQVQPVPDTEIHRVDGAAEFPSGSEIADMGSLRGRKRGRKELKGSLLAIPGFT